MSNAPTTPLVSVIVPVYNNETYVVTCMNSLLAQTLQDIEVICINDGSTDNSSQVLHDFANRDNRVVVVDKINEGYGVGINTGLKLAKGKYVTILESDDFADLTMLETLTHYAEKFEVEVVRANFNLYWSRKIKNDTFLELFKEEVCDRVIDPRIRENQTCFYAQPALWSAIYRRDFIENNNLKLTETPGAAYQDTAFNFKIWACATKVMFVHRPFVHYRQDNEASSINNPAKVDNICIEYEEIRRWLREDRPDLQQSLAPVVTKMMCDAYTWNTGRVAEEYRLDFARKFGQELSAAKNRGEFDKSLFDYDELKIVEKSITDPQAFVDYVALDYDPQQGVDLLKRKASTFIKVMKEQGAGGAKDLASEKLGGTKRVDNLIDARDDEMCTRKAPKFIDKPELPQISVVLTVYNGESVVRETLDTILAQSFEAFELICVNDGSSDSSLAILEEYAARDARIKIISQENGGPAKARNRGLAEVTAPYALILDCDDIFAPTMFERLLSKAMVGDADIVVCTSAMYEGDSYTTIPSPWTLKLDLLPRNKPYFIPDDVKDSLFEAIMGWPWDKLYRSELIKESGILFPEDLANSEDGVFVYELLYRASRLAIVEDCLIKHRETRKGSVSNTRESDAECFYEAICRIKSDMKSLPGVYEKFEKSFLNWALDYTFWNFTTLSDAALRRRLMKKFCRNGYPELEFSSHDWSYFDLYGDLRYRYNRLKVLGW